MIYSPYFFRQGFAKFTIDIVERYGANGSTPETEMWVRVLQPLIFFRKFFRFYNREKLNLWKRGFEMKKVLIGLRQFIENHSEFIDSLAKGVIGANRYISTGGGYVSIN